MVHAGRHGCHVRLGEGVKEGPEVLGGPVEVQVMWKKEKNQEIRKDKDVENKRMSHMCHQYFWMV